MHHHAVVQNTFIAIFGKESEDEIERPRARSADVATRGRSPLASAGVENLTKVLQLAHGAYKAEPLAVPELKAPASCSLKKSKLRQVCSNSSVSTMAPEDDDILEDMDDSDLSESPKLGETPKSASTLKEEFQHSRVPRQHNLAEEFAKSDGAAEPTTMMIRNIPNRYTQRDLIKELEGLGLADTFDFFYAPIDMGTMGNVGYAFVNFIEPQHAAKCQELVNGYMFKKHQSRKKIASVSVAHLQGLQANLAHYENTVVNGRSRARRCGPVILTNLTGAV